MDSAPAVFVCAVATLAAPTLADPSVFGQPRIRGGRMAYRRFVACCGIGRWKLTLLSGARRVK